MELTDWELVQKSQAGDVDAFQQLVSRYHQKVFTVILGLLRNRDDAMDVAQETFFRAFRRSEFQGRLIVLHLVYRIGVNIAIDAQRAEKEPFGLRKPWIRLSRSKTSPGDPFLMCMI